MPSRNLERYLVGRGEGNSWMIERPRVSSKREAYRIARRCVRGAGDSFYAYVVDTTVDPEVFNNSTGYPRDTIAMWKNGICLFS